MYQIDSDGRKLCPSCGAREGVEVVYIHPIEERVKKTDRRQQTSLHLIPAGGDRRKSPDRRVRSEWQQLPGTSDNPLISCLACLHEWRSLPSGTELADAGRSGAHPAVSA